MDTGLQFPADFGGFSVTSTTFPTLKIKNIQCIQNTK